MKKNLKNNKIKFTDPREAKNCYPAVKKNKSFIYTAESVTPLIVAGKTPKTGK